MRGVVYLPPDACDRSCPAVVQNLGSYSALQAIQGEAPLFATRGYAYLLAWNEGSKEEVADRVFERWAADADAILEWLGQQPWCASGMCQPPLATTSQLLDTASALRQRTPMPHHTPRHVHDTDPRCDGRVVTHGSSLMGSTSFALVQAAQGDVASCDAQPRRPTVCAAVPALSFSRVHPTVFLGGHGA